MEDLLTADQVGARLGIHPDQVYYHARKGHIPCVRMGRSVWFVESQIERWAEQGGSLTRTDSGINVNGEEVRHG